MLSCLETVGVSTMDFGCDLDLQKDLDCRRLGVVYVCSYDNDIGIVRFCIQNGVVAAILKNVL